MIIKEFSEYPDFIVKFLVPYSNKYCKRSVKILDSSISFVPFFNQVCSSIAGIDINLPINEVVVMDYDNEIWVIISGDSYDMDAVSKIADI